MIRKSQIESEYFQKTSGGEIILSKNTKGISILKIMRCQFGVMQ